MPEEKPVFIPQENKSLPRCWAGLAVLSLMLSGLAPLLLIAGRASIYAEMEFVKAWFVPVLVVHVNLSVGLWFLAVAAMLWSFLLRDDYGRYLHKAANISFLLSILCIALAPLAGGDAYTSNYIPVQDNPVFFIGLGLVTASLLLMIFAALRSVNWKDFFPFLIGINALTLLVALICFALSVNQHPPGFSGEPYYETIFWGGGHLLQFVYVQLAMIAWLWTAKHLALPTPSEGFSKLLFVLLFIAAAISPLIYVFADINSYAHIKFFTWQMNLVTGTLPAVLLLLLLIAWPKAQWRQDKPVAFCLLMSFILFIEGGLLGYLIDGSNVTIPAHYHGSTVGVTLALMGLIYRLLPAWGMENLAGSKLAIAQPLLYGIGQIMHASGLAWAGSHDIARKTAGALSESQQGAEIALQVMRTGGLLAVLGGGLFVFLMLRSYYRFHKTQKLSY